jgi:tetratricopeptide (TPR) repeat protein
MKNFACLTFCLIAATPSAVALQAHQPAVSQAQETFPEAAAHQKPGDKRIAEAQRQLAKDPKRPQAYDELALAYIRRARDADDPALLDRASEALQQGLQLAPGDFQLEKASVALLLGRQQFVAALEKARSLNRKVPDDVTVYGYVAEADLALGNYADAGSSTQWMINMRPNNVYGLLLGAELRVIYGDTPGALDFLNQAFAETSQVDPEQMAWVADRIAMVSLDAGQVATAGQALARAEELDPHSPITLMGMARLDLAQGKPSDAVTLLNRRLLEEQAHHTSQMSTLYLLMEAEAQASQTRTATPARFSASAQADAAKPLHDNTELILYDLGPVDGPTRDAAQALRLAQQQVAWRQDVWTLDAYAWSLYENGRYAEADAQIQKALATGIHSAQIDEHAGEIALKLKKPELALQNFTAALQANPTSPFAAAARRQLGGGAQVAATPQAAAVETLRTPPAEIPAMPVVEGKDMGGVPAALLIPRPTGTDRAIGKMQAQVTAHPKDAAGYTGLGAAFFQRARETGDVEDYQLAEQALTKSLDLVSTDISAAGPLETLAEVCMGEHRFTDALTYAQRALALGSGDLSAFAIVGDAYADMGEYEKAGIAYSRLQPVTATAPLEAREAYAQQSRMAYLKFVSGDIEGAIAEMRIAVDEGVQAQLPSENRAWLYFELGEFSYQAGRIQAAGDAYLTALTIHPGDYRALAGLGKVRASQSQYKEAITLYQSAIAVVPMPIYVAELGDIYQKTGDTANAEKQYKLVQYIGLLGHINQVLHNRDLALFYADHDRNLTEALSLARKEFEVRSDIYTWDALAWALYKNGQYAEADEAMSHAMRLGTKDALLFFHAGMISAKSGHDVRAAQQLNEAIRINPHFHPLYSQVATQQLSALRHAAPLTTSATAARSMKVSDAQ